MTTLKTFNAQNVTNTAQFSKALSSVFSGIQGRNNQVQQLIIIALEQARTGNNLSWLMDILVHAENTRGINLKKIHDYIVTYICKDTVEIRTKNKKVDGKPVKIRSLGTKKDSSLELIALEKIDTTWFDYGKEPRLEDIDYKAKLSRALQTAVNKGKLSADDIVDALMLAEIPVTDMMKAFDSVSVTGTPVARKEKKTLSHEAH